MYSLLYELNHKNQIIRIFKYSLTSLLYKMLDILESADKSGCLASQHIRALIKDSIITIDENFDNKVESRIQPASFDPTIDDEIFVVDTTHGFFRPRWDMTIREALLESGLVVKKYSLNGGFELKKGFTYLIPLRERIKHLPNVFIKSSPKSSFGRLFFNTRLLVDYNASFDEFTTIKDKELSLWLLVQPLVFNTIIYSGMSLNQLRFFVRGDSRLTHSEIIREFRENQLLYKKHGKNKELKPITTPRITDGVYVHLDLKGEQTNGIVGLRAKHAWEAIDLRKKNYYDPLDFFEPLMIDSRIKLLPNEFYLFATKEFLSIPKHLSCEVRSHSEIGIQGTLHFAGFIDNGFQGDLVLEVMPKEFSTMILNDASPISKLDFFRTIEEPDKVYGEKIGSHYQGQLGVRPAKYFKRIEY